MKQFLIIFLILSISVSLGLSYSNSLIDDIPFKPIKTSADRIREHGYPAESHFVETKDGYRLNLFRIPYSPKLHNINVNKPVVFIQHGLFSCSDSFLLNGPGDSLAFNFADSGFDVWLGNSRGNIYSRNNTKISLNNPYFWSFSWHEIGNSDVPEMIDYVLNKTKQDRLHYVGHSQGSAAFFVMTSTRPEYNKKIKSAHMLAPPIFMGNATNIFLVGLAPYVGKPGRGASLLGEQQFLPYNPIVQRLIDTACDEKFPYRKYCATLFLLWAGFENTNLNMVNLEKKMIAAPIAITHLTQKKDNKSVTKSLLPQVVETHPAGISTNQAIHFIQEYVSNEFRQYDYGRRKNIRKYGQPEPPVYPIELITSDLYIYYGVADTSAHFKDVARLENLLPNLKMFHKVPNPVWGHLDFIFARQVKEMINDPVIKICKKYEENVDSN